MIDIGCIRETMDEIGSTLCNNLEGLNDSYMGALDEGKSMTVTIKLKIGAPIDIEEGNDRGIPREFKISYMNELSGNIIPK